MDAFWSDIIKAFGAVGLAAFVVIMLIRLMQSIVTGWRERNQQQATIAEITAKNQTNSIALIGSMQETFKEQNTRLETVRISVDDTADETRHVLMALTEQNKNLVKIIEQNQHVITESKLTGDRVQGIVEGFVGLTTDYHAAIEAHSRQIQAAFENHRMQISTAVLGIPAGVQTVFDATLASTTQAAMDQIVERIDLNLKHNFALFEKSMTVWREEFILQMRNVLNKRPGDPLTVTFQPQLAGESLPKPPEGIPLAERHDA